jgi:hypothetical protein
MANSHDIQKSQRLAKATYDFTVVGGAASTIQLPGSDIIPNGAIIKSITIDNLTSFNSGGSATIAITGGGVTLTTALAFGTAPLNTAPATGNLTLASSATAIKATASAPIAVVIGTAALTSGKMDIYIQYII